MFNRLCNFVNLTIAMKSNTSGILVSFRNNVSAPCPCCHGRHFELVQKSFCMATRKTSAIFGNKHRA
jgi:hypothetical protein